MKARYKQSRIEKETYKMVMFIVALQLGLSLGAAISKVSMQERTFWYLELPAKRETGLYLFVTTLQWYIILLNFVPVVLFCAYEIVKFWQAFFFAWDVEMMHGDQACRVQASNLNEELGMVQKVFSDKTGTITQNKLVFRHHSLQSTLPLALCHELRIDTTIIGESQDEIAIIQFLKTQQVQIWSDGRCTKVDGVAY